ncbi:AAR2 protein-domain-containing protein [Achaetomium macrosporum]|uniref:AAR2 protein-domain-containing protein n=1 Tax=Achaetomium macrosporum TaxID=79813 RepID=A0AAN7C5D6_9PEZI|nr:AAR2 protein-domain-containing protein [Achaetomium macrosporum]
MASLARLEGSEAGSRPPPSYPQKGLKGDVFSILGLPERFIVGLDALAMTTKRSLPGFRDIPPGPHFLWVQQPGGVSRCGYWFVTGTQGVVRTKQWDRYNEVLGEPASNDDVVNIESVYPTLQPYTLLEHRNNVSASLPMSSNDILLQWARFPARLWNTLTNAISTESLSRLFGKGAVREYLVDSVDSLNFLFAQDIRDMQILDAGPPESRVSDTSTRVQALLDTVENPVTERDILAELQFTFLTGTHLGNSACLEQWWNLVLKIVLRAYSLAIGRPLLAKDLLQTLFAQLFYTEHYVGSSSSCSSHTSHTDQPHEQGTKKDGPNSDRPIFQYKPRMKEKLLQMLSQYKGKLEELLLSRNSHITPAQQAVGKVFEELGAWLWQYNWDLTGKYTSGRERAMPDVADSDEEEDEQPVVVELDEEGREVGLVSFRD